MRLAATGHHTMSTSRPEKEQLCFLAIPMATLAANLGTVSSTHSKRRGVFKSTKKRFYWNIRFMQLTVLCFPRINGFGLRFWDLMRKRGYNVQPIHS